VEMTDRLIQAAQERVAVSDQSSIGECRRSAKRVAEGYRFDEASVGRICIIATEIATNIFRHAGSGCVLLQTLDDGIQPELEILGIDQGPGMNNVDECMRDGFSTTGTAGQGLGAVSRLSTTFDLFSQPDQGTVVLSRTKGKAISPLVSAPTAGLQFGAICLAVAGEIECGDCWRLAASAAQIGMLVVDGLGHGPLAARAAKDAAAGFEPKPLDEPQSLVQTLHRALSGTRGAAAASALLNTENRRVAFAGVGNICGAVVTAERSRGMVSHNGILGVNLLRTQQFEYDWPIGSLVVMHSDGMSARWDLKAYPGLMQRHPAIIAGLLFRDFARSRDDVSVLVVSHTP
jgi:anti-sigma regulatory factor (Ser/Thr protein kinase)